MKKLLALCIIAALAGCSSSSDFTKGKRILEGQGYTEIENTGYESWCCSDSDTWSTGFKAKDKNGQEVTGCFCSAAGKGLTIRYN